MQITYLGHASFLIKGSHAKVVMDPFSSERMKHPYPSLEADIVTVSHDHDDHNAADSIKGDPLIISIPGEYEKNDVRVYGFDTYHDTQQGAERGRNTIFKVEIDDMSIVHCGDLGHMLSSEVIEDIDGADILLVPVGGFYTIDADDARQVMEKLEPSVVIPMHYKNTNMDPEIMNNLAPVEDFLEKVGVTEPERVKSLTIKKSDLVEDTTRIVVMEPTS